MGSTNLGLSFCGSKAVQRASVGPQAHHNDLPRLDENDPSRCGGVETYNIKITMRFGQ